MKFWIIGSKKFWSSLDNWGLPEPWDDRISSLIGRYHDLQEKLGKGTISEEKLELTTNQIREGIFSLLKQMEG